VQAARTLATISNGSDACRDALIHADAVMPLVSLLGSKLGIVSDIAARVLVNVTNGSDDRR